MIKIVNHCIQKILLGVFLTLVSASVFSQNYSTLPKGLLFYEPEEKLPINFLMIPERFISGIKIIDTTTSELDTFFHFQLEHMILGNRKGPSLLGKGIEKRTDGSEIFFNIADEEIKILPEAAIDSSWIIWENSSGEYVEARIIQIEPATILGEADSVKVISLRHYYSNGTLRTSRVNDMEIHISKHHGLSKVFNFREFPYVSTNIPYEYNEDRLFAYNLIGNTATKSGLQKLLIRDILDFNEGDFLRYTESVDQEGGLDYTWVHNIAINECYLSPGGDSLWLAQTDESYLYNNHSNSRIETTEEWIAGVNLSLISFEDYGIDQRYPIDVPLEINPNQNFLESGFLIFRNEQYGGRFQVLLFNEGGWGLMLWDSGYKSMMTFGGDLYHLVYGCGGYYTMAYSEGYGGILHKEKLIYFRKGEEEWGIPLKNPESFRSDNPEILISPNPVYDLLRIDFKQPESQDGFKYSIYNSLGKLIMQDKLLVNSEPSIDCSFLTPGVYFLQLSGNEFYRIKFIKQ